MTNRPLYQVTMSTDGNHKVTVTIEDPAGTDAALAWAKATHAKLLRTDDQPESSRDDVDEAPECQVHRLPMTRVQGRMGPFWSCHNKNQDGSWCNYKPKTP